MSSSRKKEKKEIPPPAPAVAASGKTVPGWLTTALPYGIITMAVGIFYWPILSAQGWLWNDFPEQNFVYRLFAAVSLKQGIFPFWNPYVFSGMPFFADVQAAVLYPLNLALTPFASSDWLSPLLVEYQIILHILLAGIFMFWLCRDLGLARSAAVLSGLTFMFCGFLTAHIFHSNLVQTAVWFPLIVLLFRRMWERRSIFYLVLASFALASAFMAGYPQLMLHLYYWLGAYAVFSIIVSLREKNFNLKVQGAQSLLFAVLVALSIGLSSVQLLPTDDLGKNSARPTMEFRESCEGSLRPYRCITFAVPKFFGTPRENYWGISPDDPRPGMHYYWETAVYCGVLPLLFAFVALALVRTPIVIFLSLMALISFLFALGDSSFFYRLGYDFLPGLNRFRVPGRFAFMLSFSVAILAGFGLEALIRKQWTGHKGRRVLVVRSAGVIAGATLIAALAVSSGMLKGWVGEFIQRAGAFGSNPAEIGRYIEQHLYPALTGSVWLFAFFSLCAIGLVILRLTGKTGARTMVAAALALTLADLLAYGYGFASSPDDPNEMYRKNATVLELQEQLTTGFFRINSRDSKPGTTDLGGRNMVFQKNQGSVHRLFLMEGYNPLRLKHQIVERGRHALDILNVKYAIQADETSGSLGLALNPTFLPRARMVYDYRVIAAQDSVLPVLRSEGFNHVSTVILEKQPGTASYGFGDSVRWNASITAYGLNRMTISVETARDGLLVLSEIHYPSWQATVDGRPAEVYRADYALRAIEVPAGSHVVSCYYRDAVFEKGRNISLISLCAALGLLGVVRIGGSRRKKERAGDQTLYPS